MGQEIERKFLVAGDFKKEATKSTHVIQGYLSSVAERTVRIRVMGEEAFLTIKGMNNESGASRFEWEKEISLNDATELLKLCEPGVIDKIRYYIPVDNVVFEVDEFFGDNFGLVVAEVELKSENQVFYKPEWLGNEVTGDVRYYNSALMKNPYKNWK